MNHRRVHIIILIAVVLLAPGTTGSATDTTKPYDAIGRDAGGPQGSREALIEERLQRLARADTPARPEISNREVEPALTASPRLWSEEDLEEDVDTIVAAWQADALTSPESKLLAQKQLLAMPSEPSFSSQKNTTQWQPIGIGIHDRPGGDHHKAGRIRDGQYVFADDLGYTTLYLASSGGGLFRFVSILIVGAWVPLTDNLPAEAMIGAFVVDETNSDRILVATGDYGRRKGTGVYRTTNGGDTWTRTGPDPYPINSLQMIQDHSNPNVVLMAGCYSYDPSVTQNSGIWRSEDFGLSWSQVFDGPVTDLQQDPTAPSFWLAGASGIGVLESSDSGHSFHAIGGTGGGGLGGAAARRINYTISQSSPSYHYLVATDPGGWHGIFRSINYGYNWVRIDDGDSISWGTGFANTAIAVAPNDRGRLFVGMGGSQTTANADASNPADVCWRPNGGTCGSDFDGGHADFSGFLFVPGAIAPGNTRVITLNDGGYYIYDWTADTIDGGGNVLGLNVAQHWPDYRGSLAASRSDPTLLLAGLFDNGVVRIDTNHSQKVRTVWGGDGGKVQISPDDPDHWLMAWGLGWSRNLSTNAGTNWSDLDCTITVPNNPGIQTDPTPGFANKIFTYNDRFLWHKPLSSTCDWGLVNPLAQPIGPIGFNINHMDQANNAGRYIFYVTGLFDRRLYVLDGGSLGSMVAEERTPPLPAGNYSRAAVFADRSSLQPETIYYTTSEGRPSRAYLSTNAGDTWRDVTGNLVSLAPDIEYRELVGDPRNLDHLFLATNLGVFRSDDRGLTWYRYMNGLPTIIDAMSIELVSDGLADAILTIGSFGRGWWQRVLDDEPLELHALFEDGFEAGNISWWSGG